MALRLMAGLTDRAEEKYGMTPDTALQVRNAVNDLIKAAILIRTEVNQHADRGESPTEIKDIRRQRADAIEAGGVELTRPFRSRRAEIQQTMQVPKIPGTPAQAKAIRDGIRASLKQNLNTHEITRRYLELCGTGENDTTLAAIMHDPAMVPANILRRGENVRNRRLFPDLMKTLEVTDRAIWMIERTAQKAKQAVDGR